MGLTYSSVGKNASDNDFKISKKTRDDIVIALAGNPNVGKSTIFNALTGLHQHTGNWTGKTVSCAVGECSHDNKNYFFVDLPGCYSLMAHSPEEEIARDFLLSKQADVTIVVCDATCIERNLNLVLQTIEICDNVIVCVNLIDEANRKRINVNTDLLEKSLGVPVISTSAKDKSGLDVIFSAIKRKRISQKIKIDYGFEIERSLSILTSVISRFYGERVDPRWLAVRLLNQDYSGFDFVLDNCEVASALDEAENLLDMSITDINDKTAVSIIRTAHEIASKCVTYKNSAYKNRDRKIDKILTSKYTAFPLMFLGLCVIFWLTITGANYPSELLSQGFAFLENKLLLLFSYIGTPQFITDMLVCGVFRVLSWVVSVMLPPMAIFFPLFTLLEDLGVLPRIAFNLDRAFKKCDACGKQALTMCMGFGCNAAGVVGCRIIDSPRERLIAIITNNFVPCNGRFPTMISVITIFFIGSFAGITKSFLSALILCLIILLGVAITFLMSKLLSSTVLKGMPSSFILELPPYRKPQILKVLTRSVCDRTLFVLGRAAAIAAPAGLVIWLLANIEINNITILSHCCTFLDPFARLIGLDGVLLTAFILGFPANEIVIPLAVMTYMANSQITQLPTIAKLGQIFIDNGWTSVTAVCVIIFSLLHFPCSTTLWTIKKETDSYLWTAISFILPTVTGIIVCFLINCISKLF